jgi:hypothetical protein
VKENVEYVDMGLLVSSTRRLIVYAVWVVALNYGIVKVFVNVLPSV